MSIEHEAIQAEGGGRARRAQQRGKWRRHLGFLAAQRLRRRRRKHALAVGDESSHIVVGARVDELALQSDARGARSGAPAKRRGCGLVGPLGRL